MNIRTYFRGLLYPKNSQKYGINLKNKKVCHSVIYEGKKENQLDVSLTLVGKST